jgi:hypothetical protein
MVQSPGAPALAAAAIALAGCALLAGEAPLHPFRDLNDVVAIERAGDRIRFSTPNGELLFDPRSEAWEVRPSESAGAAPARDDHGLDLYDPRAEALLPAWYEKSTYGAIVATAGEEGRWLLVHRVGEGANYDHDDVVDVAGGVYYRLAAQDARALLVTPRDVWIGHARGVTRIRRETGRATGYVALPNAAAASGWVENDGVRYVTTPDGWLLAVRAAGEVDALELPLALLHAHDAAWRWRRSELPEDVRWRLTNPVLRDGRLYVGAFATNPLGESARSESLLLAFELASRSWSVRLLPPMMRVRHLVEHAEGLWMLGSWSESGEGGYYVEYGGIALLTPDGRIVALERCAGRPVVSWLGHAAGISFLGRSIDDGATDYWECRVERESLHASRWLRLAAASRAPGSYPERSFELTPAELAELSGWRVRPRVAERAPPLLETGPGAGGLR